MRWPLGVAVAQDWAVIVAMDTTATEAIAIVAACAAQTAIILDSGNTSLL